MILHDRGYKHFIPIVCKAISHPGRPIDSSPGQGNGSMFYEKLFMTAHFNRNNSFFTSLTQIFLKTFISSPKILCRTSLSSLHIFVRNGTFYAPLHVKTCPALYKFTGVFDTLSRD